MAPSLRELALGVVSIFRFSSEKKTVDSNGLASSNFGIHDSDASDPSSPIPDDSGVLSSTPPAFVDTSEEYGGDWDWDVEGSAGERLKPVKSSWEDDDFMNNLPVQDSSDPDPQAESSAAGQTSSTPNIHPDEPPIPTIFIDTIPLLQELIDDIAVVKDCVSGLPCLYLDAESSGHNRNGTLCILQLYLYMEHPAFGLKEKNYVIDVFVLKESTFCTPGRNSATNLKDILEDRWIDKVWFDVRMDSDALNGQYGIHMTAVWDLQLMELLTRKRYTKFIRGLANCFCDLKLPWAEYNRIERVKREGRDMCEEKGFELFTVRPLAPELLEYCVGDVEYMRQLFLCYQKKIEGSRPCITWILEESQRRVDLALGPEFWYDTNLMRRGLSHGECSKIWCDLGPVVLSSPQQSQ